MGDTGFVGAEHEFHDEVFAAGWAERFTPTAPRLRLFDAIVEQVRGSPAAAGRVVELGVGPGFLAERVLAGLPAVQYVALDFSEPFLSIARRRLARFAGRVTFVQADLLSSRWPAAIEGSVDACVSTWALHDLGGPDATFKVYRDCAELLAAGGVLLNGDFVKPEGTAYVFEPGRFEVNGHLELLRLSGFARCECLEMFEVEIESPTPSQNYALLAGRR
jgi:SAM-dependent methyltransferase